MRARHAVTVLSLVAASLLPSVAVGQADDATAGPVRMQGTVDPLTGRPSLRPKDLKTPGAGWADDGHPLTAGNAQVHAAQGVDAIAVLQVRAGQAHAHFSKSAARAASSMPL